MGLTGESSVAIICKLTNSNGSQDHSVEGEFEKNSILASMLPRDRARLAIRAERTELISRDTLEDDSQPDYILFPVGGAVSIVHLSQGGNAVEVGIVGCEGMIGLGDLFGGLETFYRIIVQGAGAAIRVPLDAFSEEFERGGRLREAVLRYANFHMHQLSQGAICNRLHTIEQRLARWLLLISDRTRVDDLRVSQEFLSFMLGARRASVNEIVQKFKESGALIHSRSRIRLANKPALRNHSCECYRALTLALASIGAPFPTLSADPVQKTYTASSAGL